MGHGDNLGLLFGYAGCHQREQIPRRVTPASALRLTGGYTKNLVKSCNITIISDCCTQLIYECPVL